MELYVTLNSKFNITVVKQHIKLYKYSINVLRDDAVVFKVDLNISFSWYLMLLPIDVRMVNVVLNYFLLLLSSS